MAPSNFCTTSVLLLSLVILASAYEHKHVEKKKPHFSNPYYRETIRKSKAKENGKLLFNKPNYEKQDTEGHEKPLYENTNYDQPKSEEKEKFPINNPEKKQPKNDQEKEKSILTKPVYEEPKYYEGREKFVPTKPDYEVPNTISVQGLVYCKTGLKLSPLPGSVGKVTCLALDEESYETTEFSILSKPCDSKGYFYMTISSPKSQWKIKNCKVYLNYSPLTTCNIPTNVNNGVSGDLLGSSYKILSHHNNMKLFSVGPFFYASPDQAYDKSPVTNNGY